MSTSTPSSQSQSQSGFRFPASKIPIASPSGSPKDRDRDKEAKRLSSTAQEGETKRPTTPSHPRSSSRTESHLPVKSHRPSSSLSSSSSFRPSTPSSHFNNSTSTPSSHHHRHHHHTTSNPTLPTAPHTPKHDPNPHPYAIKTTSTALLSRSSSRSSSHYESYHHYVPSSPSPVSPTVKRGKGYGWGGASESESEDGTNNGTGRHRYSRSLTGDEVPPLPVPPKEVLGAHGTAGGMVYSEPEGVKSDKEEEEDNTPKKGTAGGRVRPSAKDLFASGEKGRGHRYSQSHGVILERAGAGRGEGEIKRQHTGGQIQRQHTGGRLQRQDTGDQQLDILAELTADPKLWTVAQLSTYLVSALGSNPGSGVPTPIANDIATFVRNKRITGKAFLKLSEAELKEWGINQLWRSTLISAKGRLRRGSVRGRILSGLGSGFGDEEKEDGGDGEEDEVDEPVPSSDVTSSGFDAGWTFKKGSRRLRSVPLNDLDDNDNDDDNGSSRSSKSSHSRSSSVASNASGRVRDMIDSLERSASASSTSSGLDEEGSVSEGAGAGTESRIEGWKKGMRGGSPVKRDFASNSAAASALTRGGAAGQTQKGLPVRGSVNDLFGPPPPPAGVGGGLYQPGDEEEDADATVKKKKDDDATVTSKTRALNGREPRLLPFPPTSNGAHHHRVITPSNTGAGYPLPSSPQHELYNDPNTTSPSVPVDAYEFGVKRWNQFGYPSPNPNPTQIPFGPQPYEPPPPQHQQHQHQPFLDAHPYSNAHALHHPQHQPYPHLHPQHQPHPYPHSQHQHQLHSHSQHQHQPHGHSQQSQHRIASPQTQLYVVRHNPSPGVTSPGVGGSTGSPGGGSPSSANSRGSNSSRGSAGKRLLPYPPVVKEAELHHPRPKRVIGVWDGEGEGEDGDEAEGEESPPGAGKEGGSESQSGIESGVEGYVTALETADPSSDSASTSNSSLAEPHHDDAEGEGDKTIIVKVHGEDDEEGEGDEPSIEELLKRGDPGVEEGKGVSGVEAWEMELGETVKRISASLRTGKGGGGASVRGPRLSPGGMHNIVAAQSMVGNLDVGIGVHGDGTMSVGDLSSVSMGRKAGDVSEIGRKAGTKTGLGAGGTKRGGVLELFSIPPPTATQDQDQAQAQDNEQDQRPTHDEIHALASKEHQLAEEEFALVERDLSLVERQRDLEERDQALEERERDLDARERVLDEFKDALDRRAEGMDRRGGMLDEREGEVREREGILQDREGEEGLKEAEVLERERDVKIREGELDERENKLDEREGRVLEREDVGRVWEGEVGERERRLDERALRLDEREMKLDERERKLEEREEKVEENEAEVGRARDALTEDEERMHNREVAVEKREEKVVDSERRVKNRLREVQRKEKEIEEREVEGMKRDEERKQQARASAQDGVRVLENVGVGLEGREREVERKEREVQERERVVKAKEAALEALEKEMGAKRGDDDSDHPLWPLPISLLRKGWGSLVMPLVGAERTPEFLLPYQPPRAPGASVAMGDDEAEQDRPGSPVEGNESVVSAGSTSTVTPGRNLKRTVGDPTSASSSTSGSSTSPSTSTSEERTTIPSKLIKRDFLLGRLGFGYLTNAPGEGGMFGGRLNGGYWVLMSIGVCCVVLKALSLGGVRGIGGVLRGGGAR